MAWDDISDMWWMGPPEKSNLPELATGAFLKGMGMAQEKAQFDALLPLRVAESNAQTAARVAQTKIATQQAERENAEWEKESREQPSLSKYAQDVAVWMSDPLTQSPVPVMPADLTGTRQATAAKMFQEASLLKRQQMNRSLAAQVALQDETDKLQLVKDGFLTLQDAGDIEKVKLARMNRAGRESEAIAKQMGIQNLPMTVLPTLPNGDLDKETWAAEVKKFKPTVQPPTGMEVDTIAYDASGNPRYTFKRIEAQKPGKSREDFIRETAATLAKDGRSATDAVAEATEIWASSTGQGGSTAPRTIEVTQETIQEQWDKAAGGTQFVAMDDIKLPDGGKIRKGTIVTKKSPEKMQSERKDKLVERRNELRSDIRVGSRPGPFEEEVTAEQLFEERQTMPDRTQASQFLTPTNAGTARRIRQRTPEDDQRLKKMQDELSSVLKELQSMGR